MYFKSEFAALMIMVTVTVVSSAPAPIVRDVSTIANRTICPMRVTVDEVKDRIPSKIKMMECLEPAAEHRDVRQHLHPRHHCENIVRHQQQGRCVQLVDTAYVLINGQQAPTQVKVGCVCMLVDLSEAHNAADHPPLTH